MNQYYETCLKDVLLYTVHVNNPLRSFVMVGYFYFPDCMDL